VTDAGLAELVDRQLEIASLTGEIDAVKRAIVEEALVSLAGDGAALTAPDGDRLVFAVAVGSSAPLLGSSIASEGSVGGRCFREGRPLLIADLSCEPTAEAERVDNLGGGSIVLAPLVHGDRTLGVLSVHAAARGAFTTDSLATLALLARSAAIALRHAHVIERLASAEQNETLLRDSLDHLRSIVEMQREIAELEIDPAAVTGAILDRTQRLTGADGAVVLRLEADAAVWEHASGAATPFVGLRVKRPASLAGLAAATGETHYSPDVECDPRVDIDAARSAGIRSLVCAPLLRASEPVAVLSVSAGRPHAFDEIAVETARLMAEFVGAALRNTDELEARKRMTEALRTQGHVVEHMQTGLYIWGLDAHDVFRLEYANAASEEAIGLPVDEVLGRRLDEVLPGLAPRVEQTFRTLVATGGMVDGGEVEYGDDRIPTRIFSVKTFSLSTARIAVTFENVTGRVRAARALQESEQLFSSVFERSVVPKLILNDDRALIDLNDAAAQLLGVARDEALRLSIDDLLPGQSLDRVWARFKRTGVAEGETPLLRPDGARRLIEFTATANVQPGRHIVVIRDLTRQRDLELQLRQAQRMEAVGRLAGGIAHDFNNLLTAISGYSELLTASLEEPKLRRHAEEIGKAASRAAALTGQLLAFSRRQVLQPRVLDLNAVVADMDTMLRRLIGEDIELITILEQDLGSVRADPTQIEQVIVNLAINARDAMPGGGSAVIRTRNVDENGSFVELSLTDTGIGMTREEQQHLFEPFFTTKEGGTGLGLATVYGIVEQSGGRIEVDSESGVGSSLRLYLPRVEAVTAVADPRSVPGDAAAPGRETILLVEDESVVRHLVAEILETSGYTVLPAADGPSALELLRRHPGSIDLLVTDVVMPGMSGPDVAKAVTSMQPGLQVLYTSGYTDSAIDRHGVLDPGIAFLQKPFSADDLMRKVRSLVEDAAPVRVD
jgi:PAS domain S-box-containing protein